MSSASKWVVNMANVKLLLTEAHGNRIEQHSVKLADWLYHS